MSRPIKTLIGGIGLSVPVEVTNTPLLTDELVVYHVKWYMDKECTILATKEQLGDNKIKKFLKEDGLTDKFLFDPALKIISPSLVKHVKKRSSKSVTYADLRQAIMKPGWQNGRGMFLCTITDENKVISIMDFSEMKRLKEVYRVPNWLKIYYHSIRTCRLLGVWVQLVKRSLGIYD